MAIPSPAWDDRSVSGGHVFDPDQRACGLPRAWFGNPGAAGRPVFTEPAGVGQGQENPLLRVPGTARCFGVISPSLGSGSAGMAPTGQRLGSAVIAR
jgi:hypothetical protein